MIFYVADISIVCIKAHMHKRKVVITDSRYYLNDGLFKLPLNL